MPWPDEHLIKWDWPLWVTKPPVPGAPGPRWSVIDRAMREYPERSPFDEHGRWITASRR